LHRQIGCEKVDVVGQVFPGSVDARHNGLAAKAAIGTNLASYPRHLGGKGTQLLDHGVDGFLKLENFASDVDRDLFR